MLENQFLKEEVLLLNGVLNFFNSFPPESFTNTEDKTQCSVCIIFRFNPNIFEKHDLPLRNPSNNNITEEHNGFYNLIKDNSHLKLTNDVTFGLEVLFIKRAVNPKDIHSGQVALPGGKCEKDEDDFKAAIREVYEEVGLDLKDSSEYAYLGRFPKNFSGYYAKKEMRYITVHMFLHLNVNNFIAKINPDEVEEIFWVPLRFFLNPNISEMFCEQQVPIKYAAQFHPGKFYSPILSFCIDGLEAAIFQHFLLPNKTQLWGFSEFIFVYLVKNFLKVVNGNPEYFKTVRKEDIEKMLNCALVYEFKAKKESALELRKRIFKWAYYKLRIEQFDEKTTLLDAKFIGLVALLIFGPIALNGLPKL